MDPTRANSRHQIQSPSFMFTKTSTSQRDLTPRSYPTAMMDQPQVSVSGDSMGTGMAMYSAPASQNRPRPRSMAVQGNGPSYCMPQEYNSLHAWDIPATSLQTNSAIPHQTYLGHHNLYAPPSIDSWNPKAFGEGVDLQTIDADMHIGQTYTVDENMPVFDLRYSTLGMDCDPLNPETPDNTRRTSGSSFTLSTTGPLSEIPSYEDFSGSMSEAHSFTSEYPPRSNRNSLLSSTQLSPVASPRMTPQNRPELVRTQSRGRASPSPRPSMRSAPYPMDSSRSKRWSTGSYGPALSRRPSPFVYHPAPEALNQQHPPSTCSSSPINPNNQSPLNLSNFQTQQNPFIIPLNTDLNRNSMVLPSQNYAETAQFQNPPPLIPQSLFRLLQSNAEPHSLSSHYSDLLEPPDLYACLSEEPLAPPASDMNPSDPELVPHEQELRFDTDLYTPRWVRGHGNKREGWCGICKPGRWLVLKNSAFWYDKSFSHGISAATGLAFEGPLEKRRMDGNPDVWEGLCGSCGDWVALISSKKKGTTWFRHAYKCHTHPKVKDAPKRRRESNHIRAQTTKAKAEALTTPTRIANHSSSGTPTPTFSKQKKRTSAPDESSTTS
ncbi:MAG: hypothetical protein M1818_004626 [Claussenomyces sp. TS43310]|nr:MAG: hypothetical protein M1818_004626 [Claussenomyces sp. TS43310]